MSRTFRITPSKLEEFRGCIYEEYGGYITQDLVIQSIKGEKEWTPEATFGSAFGLVLEHGLDKFPQVDVGIYEVQGSDMPEPYMLDVEEAWPAVELRMQYPGATHEAWSWIEYDLDSSTHIKAPFICDFLHGFTIHEVKTTKRPVDAKYYMRSMQWRMYLLFLTGSKRCKYHIYQYTPRSNKSAINWIKRPINIDMYPYPDLRSDVDRELYHFLEFCDRHSLLSYIER